MNQENKSSKDWSNQELTSELAARVKNNTLALSEIMELIGILLKVNQETPALTNNSDLVEQIQFLKNMALGLTKLENQSENQLAGIISKLLSHLATIFTTIEQRLKTFEKKLEIN